jgi:hypothetical protein
LKRPNIYVRRKAKKGQKGSKVPQKEASEKWP